MAILDMITNGTMEAVKSKTFHIIDIWDYFNTETEMD